MGCVAAAIQNASSRAGLTLLLPRIGNFASLHDSAAPRTLGLATSDKARVDRYSP